MKPLVIDLYHGNPVTSFTKIKAAGIVGIIHKATQGVSVFDHAYATRRKQAVACGLLWGAYHFLDFSSSAEAQAAHFASVAEVDDNTLIALDWETIGGKQPSIELARTFLECIDLCVVRLVRQILAR